MKKDDLKTIHAKGKDIYTHRSQRVFGSVDHKNGRKKRVLRKEIARVYTNHNTNSNKKRGMKKEARKTVMSEKGKKLKRNGCVKQYERYACCFGTAIC